MVDPWSAVLSSEDRLLQQNLKDSPQYRQKREKNPVSESACNMITEVMGVDRGAYRFRVVGVHVILCVY